MAPPKPAAVAAPSPAASSPEDEPLTAAAEAQEAETETAEAAGAEAEEKPMAPIAVSKPPKAKGKKTDKDDEDPELAKIPLLKQLPPDVQQTIPELHISFHSYSIKPSARLVSISGKILREGQEFDEGVKLVTITNKGVVMDVKGRRFRLKL